MQQVGRARQGVYNIKNMAPLHTTVWSSLRNILTKLQWGWTCQMGSFFSVYLAILCTDYYAILLFSVPDDSCYDETHEMEI